MGPWDWVVLVGGGLQVAGVAMVAVDLVATKRHVEAYDRRPVRVRARPVALQLSVGPGVARVEGGREPTLEERVERLEGSVSHLPEDVKRMTESLRARLREEIREEVGLQAQASKERHDAIEGLLRGVALGPFRLRWLGVGFLVLGISASTAGGVLA